MRPPLARGQSLRPVKVTMPVVALSMAPMYLAKARGFFAEEGLDVEMTSTGGGGPDIKALIAGEVDFTYTPGDNVVLAYQQGKRLVIVMTALGRPIINWAMHSEVATARGITAATPLAQKLAALKGLTVGVTTPGALTAHLAAFTIRKAGLVPQQDVKIIPIGGGPTWMAALQNRKVDVALTATPVPETAVARGFAVLFIDNARGEDPSLPAFLMENLMTRPEVIRKDPELVRKMVRALVRANQWALGATPEQIAEALQPTLGKTPREVLLAGIASTLPALSRDGVTPERAVGITQDVLEQAGILKQRVPYRLLLYRALLGLALLVSWQLVSGRLVDPFWISSPSRVFGYLWEVTADGSIVWHIAVTLYETVVGFVIGAVTGIGSGFALARRETLAQVLDPYIVAFNGIPRIALAPLFIIWFGIGPNSKVILVVVFFLTFFNTYSGVKGVDPELQDVVRVLGANERQVLWKVTIPATIPWVTAGLKLSVPYALVGAVVGEFMAASAGLGYLINYNTGLFSTTGAMGGILVLAVVVVLCNEAIDRAERHLLRWRPREVEGARRAPL